MAGAAVSTHIIVWEYQADIPGMFSPYADKVSNYIETNYTQNPQASVALQHVEPVLKDFSVDLGAMVQRCNTSGDNRKERQVRRMQYDNSTTIGTGIVWEWLTDLGWVTYDVDTLHAIEDAFTKNEKELDLSPLKYNLPNIVLVEKGYQKNKSSNFVRPIQRKAVSYISTGTPAQNVRKRANDVAGVKPTVPNAAPNIKSPIPSVPSVARSSGGAKPRSHVSRNQAKGKSPQRMPGGSSKSPVSAALSLPTKNADVLKFCSKANVIKDGDDCAICLIPFKDSDDDDDDNDGHDNSMLKDTTNPVVQLKNCKHCFHLSCMEAYCNQVLKDGCIQCPICKTIHGVKVGNQPPGTMNVSVDRNKSVAGYEGEGMITITYNIHRGNQGPNDPNPFQVYHPNGFPRTAYLPANPKGQKVLKLLKLAWERKLIFTIGTSTTTGQDNCVIWNEIHHKTHPRDDGSGHGYPDPKYLDNVIDELKQHGVVDQQSEF